jgi:hypothetical protein
MGAESVNKTKAKNFLLIFFCFVLGMLLAESPFDCQAPLRQRKRPIHRMCKYCLLENKESLVNLISVWSKSKNDNVLTFTRPSYEIGMFFT